MRSFVKRILRSQSAHIPPQVLAFLYGLRLKRLVWRPVRINIETSFSKNPMHFDQKDIEIARRLMAFWTKCQKNAIENDQTLGNSLWTSIVDEQKVFVDIVESADETRLLEYLYSAPKETIHRGILQGDEEFVLLQKNSRYRKLQGKITVNRFVSLIESIGGTPVQNPEQGKWGISYATDFKTLLRILDSECGFKVEVPEIFSYLLQTTIAGRKFNQVDIMALYSAISLRNLSKSLERRTLLEIGAGSGMSAYWCSKLGLGPIQIVDLPHVAVVQAFLLMKALPEVAISLYGEEELNDHASITIYPNSALDDVDLSGTAIIFNQDSFAEMSEATIHTYAEWFKAANNSILYSINHESEASFDMHGSAQSNFHNIATNSQGYTLISRSPNWIRHGYVEEVWKIMK